MAVRSAQGSVLRVVAVRYSGSVESRPDGDPIDLYTASGAFDAFGAATIVDEPSFPEERRDQDPTVNLGLLGGEIAAAVAAGRSEDQPVLVVGGNCAMLPGVIGGLQQAHGPEARVGLVWFDAHGDFNTPKTTISGMLGGMPVAVSAGLAHARWRELSQQRVPLATDRILMVDVRNLDPDEARLIQATDIIIASAAAGFPGEDLGPAVADLAARCDMLCLWVDSDILDAAFVPNHRTREPNGPDIRQTLDAIDTVMSTGKVAAFALVSVWADGEDGTRSIASAIELLQGALASWSRHGTPEIEF